MQNILIGAAVAALSLGLGAAPAFAQQTESASGGRYEWRTVPQAGPRSAVPVSRKRVWVADRTQGTNCDCDMMKMSADECMKSMHDRKAAPSAG
ncbi:hypothetical protein GCM10011349_12120 [Novosphingobium indicum]|uniref:Uncharacterized protein n=1 Tax=Novosphingobium indicum TaxID=462949 RepID=A0ABQ2JHB1_9SPHN|nr:hypothetical protein [Novosphingobium indicum]GGN45743.1 hypothetical protein GCM10011349_12120 [Novosphingobium indicum]